MYATNIQLPQSPVFDEKKYPDIFADAQSVHNAIKLIQSFLDVYTAARVTVTATESIISGHMVNIYSAGSVISARNANATTGGKHCLAFATEDISAGETGDVQTMGMNELLSGLVPGTVYYLSTAAGGLVTPTPPVAAGNLVQELGFALDTNRLIFRPSYNWKQL